MYKSKKRKTTQNIKKTTKPKFRLYGTKFIKFIKYI